MKISLDEIKPRLSHRKALIVKVLKIKGWTIRKNIVIVPDNEEEPPHYRPDDGASAKAYCVRRAI